ncbi:MAG: PEGA domain-containing protein, partial [Deltaproteobacteria bacterium]|nr:PEGA domain-containing protein [Nannocystaceae bacterium]
AVAAAPTAPARVELRAAILPLAVEGELSEVDRTAITDELVAGLRRGAFDIVPPTAVLERDGKAASCDDKACLQRVAEATNATHLVRAKVIVRDRDYDVRVELVDGRTGAVAATSEEGCEICGVVDAGSLMASASATLRTKLDALAKGPSVLTVKSEPLGAEVRIDGEIVGVTPLERPIIPGERVVRVSKEGFIAVEREITVVEGVAEEVAFGLDKVPSRLPKRPWGFVSLGLGIAGVGVAATFAALDDRPYKLGNACEGGSIDERGRCKRLWDTEWIVFGTSLAAATLVTLGVAVLLTSPGRRAKKADKPGKKKRATAKLGIGPGALLVHGRF